MKAQVGKAGEERVFVLQQSGRIVEPAEDGHGEQIRGRQFGCKLQGILKGDITDRALGSFLAQPMDGNIDFLVFAEISRPDTGCVAQRLDMTLADNLYPTDAHDTYPEFCPIRLRSLSSAFAFSSRSWGSGWVVTQPANRSSPVLRSIIGS